MRSLLSRIVVALAVAGVASSAAKAIEPKYLPPNAEVAITINLKQMLDSQLFKDKEDLIDQGKAFLKAKLDESPAKEYLDKAGFDIFRDLHSITVTSDGSKDPDAAFIVIEGEFNPEKLVAVAKEAAAAGGDKLKVTKAGNVNIFEITPKENEKTIYAGLISDSIMVAAPSRDALNATIARINGNKTAALKPAFKQVLATTNKKQSLSIVATAAGIAKMAESAPRQPGADAAAMLDSLESVALSITVNKGIAFQAAGNAKDEDSAKKMSGAGNLGLTMARGAAAQKAQDNEGLRPIVDIAKSLRITTEGNNVILRGEITQANLDQLLSLIGR